MRMAAAAPVAVEALHSRKLRQVRTRIAEPGRRVLDHAQALHEILRAERGGEARGAPVGSTWFGPAT